MSVILLVMTDGRRQYLQPAMASLQARLRGPITRRVLHDDSGDATYREFLHAQYPHWEIIGNPHGRAGCCGAYATAWTWLSEQTETWVFSTEDDFTYESEIDLLAAMRVMAAHPYLVQMTYRRQPWGTEPVVGGFVAQYDALYHEATNGTHRWLEHRRHWSNNPGIYRRALTTRGWPPEPGCEVHFGRALMAEDPTLRFGLWGAREDAPRVRHIGHERVGHSY